MDSQYNPRSPAVKRLYKEAKELFNDRTAEYFAQPLDDNLFEWHFTVRGPPDSDFASGVYHGRIILPTEYPMKPPSIIMLTPNGRFEVNKKICLSISGHHPESWQPSWSIRTALLAIIGFMPTEGLGAIGSLDYPSEERKTLAVKSQNWCCPSCGQITKLLKTDDSNYKESEANKEAKELAKQIRFKETNSESTEDKSTPIPTVSEATTTSTEPNEATVQTTEQTAEQTVEQNNISDTDPQLIHRSVSVTHSNPIMTANVTANVTLRTNINLDSGSRLTNYLIAFIVLLLAFLLFRRFFLL